MIYLATVLEAGQRKGLWGPCKKKKREREGGEKSGSSRMKTGIKKGRRRATESGRGGYLGPTRVEGGWG